MAETSHANDAVHHGASIDFGAVFDWGLTLLSGGAIAAGAFFVLAGALGVIRMPDFYTRMHAAGMTDTLGAELILVGLIIQALSAGEYQLCLKILLVALFLFLTSPTATHAIANAAHKSGLKPFLGLYKSPSLEDIESGKSGDGS